jgi:pimeloyl-ACP methyl ester carboxylesterase
MTARRDGFASLDEVAEAVRAYNPQRRRPATPAGLRKNVRWHGDRWYWHWDPAFLSHTDDDQRDRADERVSAAARAVNVPTLLLRGAQSDVVSDDGARHCFPLIPSARWVDVPATGHMVAGHDNDVFTRAVVDFLDDRDPEPVEGSAPENASRR